MLSSLPPPEKQKYKNKFSTCSKEKIVKKGNNGSTFMWWNKGNSDIFNKMDEVELMIKKHNPKIFALMEANMSPECHSPALQIADFSLERDNLLNYNIRTRTAIYVSDSLSYKRRYDLEIPQLPFIWLEIKDSPSKSWLMMAGYRQWRTLGEKNRKGSHLMKAQLERFKKWTLSMEKAEQEGKEVVILGDLNIDVTPWTNPSTIRSEYQVSMASMLSALMETTNKLNLTLVKTPPTRFQGSDTPSILDVIFSNKPEKLGNPTLFETSSDHKLIVIKKT